MFVFTREKGHEDRVAQSLYNNNGIRLNPLELKVDPHISYVMYLSDCIFERKIFVP